MQVKLESKKQEKSDVNAHFAEPNFVLQVDDKKNPKNNSYMWVWLRYVFSRLCQLKKNL